MLFWCVFLYLIPAFFTLLLTYAYYNNFILILILTTLTDDDECKLNTHNCGQLGPKYQCVNIRGSFRCKQKICPLNRVLSDNGTCISLMCDEGFMPLNSVCIGKSVAPDGESPRQLHIVYLTCIYLPFFSLLLFYFPFSISVEELQSSVVNPTVLSSCRMQNDMHCTVLYTIDTVSAIVLFIMLYDLLHLQM